MSRTIKASYLASLFASAQVFNAAQLKAAEQLATSRDPAELLLDALKSAPEGAVPAEVITATEAVVAARPLRIAASIAIIKGQQEAIANGIESLREFAAHSGDEDEDLDVGGPFGVIETANLEELEVVHAAVQATSRADALIEAMKAANPVAGQALAFGETTPNGASAYLQ